MRLSHAAIAACLLLLAGCSDDVPAVAAGPEVKAEDLVKLTTGFVCGTSDQLTEAFTHSVSGEKTKLKAMFDDGSCWPMADDVTLRVLHVEHGRIEVAPNVDAPSVSAWTALEFVTVQMPVSKS
ncbi:hypothetical protein ISN76_12895 [Dyella halodurans]|uniref:Lipoprotein n=1 Tax=Dyella halodurans TaxID=1920171 RepID=A0ABV9C098_9GAMM|nr:hypothetical protein [Dyella halodurans]